MATYSEMFPLETRVVVRAGTGRGSDELWNGHTGTLTKWPGNAWASIQMDKPKRGWPNPVVIEAFHIRKVT